MTCKEFNELGCLHRLRPATFNPPQLAPVSPIDWNLLYILHVGMKRHIQFYVFDAESTYVTEMGRSTTRYPPPPPPKDSVSGGTALEHAAPRNA
jgi:hypothetical protein